MVKSLPPDSTSEFIDFLRQNGIPPADTREIIANDRTARYTIDGDKPKSKNGVYRLGLVDGILMGWARSHKIGTTHNFMSGNYKKLSKEERAALDKSLRQKRKDSYERQQRQHEATHETAVASYAKTRAADTHHPYLKKKQIPNGKLRQSGQDLMIPLYDIHDKLWNIQKINNAGYKLFMDGGRVKGCFHQLGEPRPFRDDPYVICEGYATGATLYMATGWPVIVALQANNLLPVGCALRWKKNYAAFIYAADNDKWTKRQDGTPWNPGLEYAAAAAKATGGKVVTLPDWVSNHPSHPTDFNDMAALHGLEEVTKLFIKGGDE